MDPGSAFLKGFQSLKFASGFALHMVQPDLDLEIRLSRSASSSQLAYATYPSSGSVCASAELEAKAGLSCRAKGVLTARENWRAVKLSPRPTDRTGLKGDSFRFCSSPIGSNRDSRQRDISTKPLPQPACCSNEFALLKPLPSEKRKGSLNLKLSSLRPYGGELRSRNCRRAWPVVVFEAAQLCACPRPASKLTDDRAETLTDRVSQPDRKTALSIRHVRSVSTLKSRATAQQC